MIIGIMGKAGSGKDTVGFFIKELLEKNQINVKTYAFADGVKDVASVLTNCKRKLFDDQSFKKNTYFSLTSGFVYGVQYLPAGHELITIRQLLQKIGTEAMQGTFGKNIWINKTFSEISNDKEDDNLEIAIITDVRFKQEYKRIKHEDGILIKVINPNIKSEDIHISENDLNDVPTDYTIINNWQEDPENVNKQINELIQQITEQFRNN